MPSSPSGTVRVSQFSWHSAGSRIGAALGPQAANIGTNSARANSSFFTSTSSFGPVRPSLPLSLEVQRQCIGGPTGHRPTGMTNPSSICLTRIGGAHLTQANLPSHQILSLSGTGEMYLPSPDGTCTPQNPH